MLKTTHRSAALTSFFFFLLACFPNLSLATPEAQALPRHQNAGGQALVKTYDQLVHAIREARAASRTRIDQAIRQEKVREAWETGRLIDEHVLMHKEHADYGKYILTRLAADLETSRTQLSLMLQFARAYPILPQVEGLTWSHYCELLSVNDSKQRDALAARVVGEHWGRDRLHEEIRKSRPGGSAPQTGRVNETPLTAVPGQPGTFRVVKAKAGPYEGRLAFDLGFSNYFRPEKFGKFQDRDLVIFEKGKLKKSDARESALFTYRAYVLQVIDGDTFRALIDLGFGFVSDQTLRLRGLDAPELPGAEGREAKAFLEKQLPVGGAPVLIKTVKSDKYDRYLADVWASPARDVKIPAGSTRPTGDEWGGTYLNQELIEKGLAVKVSE